MFPVYKDFDKSVTDIFTEDFDCKYNLKVKSVGPADLVNIFSPKQTTFLLFILFLL